MALASDPRISQLLPSVKCSSCGQSVPLDKLGDHVCVPLPTSSPSSKHIPPRLKLQTAIANASRLDASSPRLPPTTPPDVRNYDRGPLRSNPSRASSRNGVRSPALPPSRTQTPILPASSARQPVSQYLGTGSSRPPPEAALNVIPGNSHPNTIHAHPSVANYRRPSVPSSPPVQVPRAAQDPRMSNRPNPPIRAPPSPAPSNYSSHHFMGPEIDTKSGGAAGMAGVGRRGFAAAARAAMFAASAPSSVRSPPTSPPPALWNSTPSFSPLPVDSRRAYPPPDVQSPPSVGTSSFISCLNFVRRSMYHLLASRGFASRHHI